MERAEPTFVPEWYKGSGNGTSGSASSNHHSRSSSHSEEYGVGLPLRNRLSVSAVDLDVPRSSAFAERSLSSFHRSVSSNGSTSHYKDSTAHSRLYSSFGRSNRDRDREKDLDLHDKDRSHLLDNGFCDPLKSSKIKKDTLSRSHSIVSGQRVESWPQRVGKDLNNGVHSRGSIVSSISKASFERDFPFLGADDKQALSDVSRVSSPGPSTAIQSLPIGTSTVIGGDSWTALAEVPIKIGGNGPGLSSAAQTAPVSLASTASVTAMSLNMAEALTQTPPRVRNVPQLSVDTQRIEELTRLQYTKLIPVTPTMPKSSVLNSSDKLKSKATKGGELSVPRMGQQSPSQLVNQAVRTPAKSDILKTSQVGNFQVLNRERNGISPTAKEGTNLMSANNVVSPHSGIPSAVAPLKSHVNPKVKVDIKGGILTSTQSNFGEKRPLSQAQNRNDFFNSLRKKTSANPSAATPEPTYVSPSPNLNKESQITGISSVNEEKENTASSSGVDCVLAKGSDADSVFDACQEPERFVPDSADGDFSSESVVEPNEEEAAFLRSLGWEENAGEEAPPLGGSFLTAEEIDTFVKEYEKLKPSLKLGHGELRPLKPALHEVGGSSALSSSDSEVEA